MLSKVKRWMVTGGAALCLISGTALFNGETVRAGEYLEAGEEEREGEEHDEEGLTDREEDWLESMLKKDTDGDKCISREESGNNDETMGLDTDKDGKVSVAELKAYLMGLREKREQKENNRGNRIERRAKEKFDACVKTADADGNGEVSEEEMQSLWTAENDADHDGKVTEEELKKYFAGVAKKEVDAEIEAEQEKKAAEKKERPQPKDGYLPRGK